MTAPPLKEPPELPEIEVWTGEEELLAILLCVIDQACTTTGDELDSGALSAYARAMRHLAESGLLDIESECGRRVFGKITPLGEAFIRRLHDEEEKEAAELWRSKTLEAYRGRRTHAVLSEGWLRAVKEARLFLRFYRVRTGRLDRRRTVPKDQLTAEDIGGP